MTGSRRAGAVVCLVAAVALLAQALLAAPTAPEPGRPTPAVQRFVCYPAAPPLGAGARLVRDQILDARDGVP